jgi:hypothetical protein
MDEDSERRLIVSTRVRFSLAYGLARRLGRSPVMPMVPVADAARTVVSPDHAAARMAIIGIIGVVIRIVAAADEVATVVHEANAAMTKPAAMKRGTAAETANMHAAAVPAATAMKTSAVEAAAHMTTAMTATTMSASAAMPASSADFGHKTTSDGFRSGR